jgi:hypothetical protein
MRDFQNNTTMNTTTFIGGPFAGVLHHEHPITPCGVIHVTTIPELPDLSKGDQHIEHHRGHYCYDPEAGAWIYFTGKGVKPA